MALKSLTRNGNLELLKIEIDRPLYPYRKMDTVGFRGVCTYFFYGDGQICAERTPSYQY